MDLFSPFDNPHIKSAAKLLFAVENNNAFAASFALYAVTVDKEFSEDSANMQAVNHILASMPSPGPRPPPSKKEDLFKYLFEKFAVIMRESRKLPRLTGKGANLISFDLYRDSKQTDAMRLAGFNNNDCTGACGTYRKVLRKWEKQIQVLNVSTGHQA